MWILALILMLSGTAESQSAAANLYNKANALYHQGRFEEARDCYLRVVESGVRDARLFYNLGNACFKSGQVGWAVLWYERARRLAPRDEDIEANLRFANQVKQDRVEVEENVVWRFLTKAFFYPTLNELCVSFALLLLVLFGLAVYRLWERSPPGAGWMAAAFLCGGLALLDGAYLAARIYHRETTVEAVVIEEQGTARSGPGEGQTAVFVVHEGTKVRVVRREGGWLLVRLGNGLGGWLPAEVVEII